MSRSEYRVAIVADPTFGELLKPLAERMHVWVADTPVNRRVAEQIWAYADAPSIEHGTTTFRVSPSESSDEWVARILPDVELHHGEYSHNPPITTLEIYGAVLSPFLQAALHSCGFTRVSAENSRIVASIPTLVR